MRALQPSLRLLLFVSAFIPLLLFVAATIVIFYSLDHVAESAAEFKASTPLTDEITHPLNQLEAEVSAATAAARWILACTLGLAMLLTGLISRHIARGIVRPLRDVLKGFEHLRQGQYSAAAPHGPPEISKLVRHFNIVGLSIRERDDALQNQARRYQGLLASAHPVLWSMNSKSAMEGEVEGWLSFTGQSKEEIGEEGWLEAIHAEDRQHFRQAWEQATFKPESALIEECRVRRPDGSYSICLCHFAPILAANGALLEWVCACTDVTERKLQEAIEKERDVIVASHLAQSQFLARMSHELKTPLNAIIGMSKMLATRRLGSLNDKQADYINDIVGAGRRLLTFINDVLDFSQVERGELPLHLEEVSLRDSLEQVVVEMQDANPHKDQAILFRRPQTDRVIVTDPGRFRQIVTNLLRNAIQSTPERGTILVRTEWLQSLSRQAQCSEGKTGTAFRVDIEDTGVNLPALAADMIGLNGDEVVPAATEADADISLSLSRRLASLLGGRIWVESQSGVRCRFSLALPTNVLLDRPALETASRIDFGRETAGEPHERFSNAGLEKTARS